MKCEEARRILRTEETVSGEAAEHLGSCESCRASWEADQALLAEMREMPAPEPGAGHARRFRRELEARLRVAGPASSSVRPVRLVGLAAAALLLVALGVVALLPLSGGPDAAAPPPPGPMAFLSPEGLTQGELAGLEEAVLTLMPESGEEIGAQVWATALGGETDWIGELSDDEQRALLEALNEDLG